jgi:hypothetical protein
MRLADVKAKPDANHANTHAQVSLVVSYLHPAPRHSTRRGSGFKSDTTRTNRARPGLTGFALIIAAILTVSETVSESSGE